MSHSDKPRQKDFDDWRTVAIAVYLTLVGYAVMVGVPVISTAWVELLGFTEEQVGRVAGADLGGLALGSILASLLMARFNRHWIAYTGLLVSILANGACLYFTTYEAVLWLRVLAGAGSGMICGVAVTTLGGNSRPAMAYNIMLFAFAFSQAAEMQVLPMLSMNGIYWVFIGAMLIAIPLVHLIPARPGPEKPLSQTIIDDPSLRVPRLIPWLCLAAIFFTYVNIGTYWTYIELASLSGGIDPHWIGRVLVWVSFGSIVGCLVATVLSNRFGLARPLMFTLAVMTLIVGVLGFDLNYTNLLISLALFNFLWIFIDVYQMGTVAVLDRRGTYAALMPGAAGLGQIVGPNIAASLLAWGYGYSAMFFFCAAAAFVSMMIYGFMYLRVRRKVPQLARSA